jgi:hypothetical protein
VRGAICDGSKFEVREAMSKNNNVNPGQYKVAGRERQGEDIVQRAEKAKVTQKAHQLREQAKGKQKKSDR